MKNRIRLIVVFLAFFLISGVPAVVAAAEQPRHYVSVGADPVNPARQVDFGGGECIAPLAEDAELSVLTGSGQWVHGWVRKGLRVVVKNGSDGSDGWILDCGNPFKADKPLPLGERQCVPKPTPQVRETAPPAQPTQSVPSSVRVDVYHHYPETQKIELSSEVKVDLSAVSLKPASLSNSGEEQPPQKGKKKGKCGKKCKIGIAVGGLGTAAAIILPSVLGGGHAAGGGFPVNHTP